MDDKPFESLNVIPFVDIMLVLLTMVLTTATFVAVGRIPIALPQASPTQVEKQKETTIEIAPGGIVHYDGSPVGLKELEQRLGDLPKDTSFIIRADKSIPFQAFIDVADALKRGGFTKVGVQTQSVGSAGKPSVQELSDDRSKPASSEP
ncbi:biopolymer transporter ExbD [Hyphomicrobium methylovorum]|uniref:ExbD/TolR family protein n=1 Tax=Hyphomicrobium methylovorum TaxID=84 RepID=UPI0015E63AEC|nr:biopolymer transporter ExbD [Hyphomicrobium methylovorum]MBA2124943.1 biopolymer transporter ExbD [Hyphomicrobium methylovorum]